MLDTLFDIKKLKTAESYIKLQVRVFDLKNRILVTSNTIAEYFEEQNGIDKSLRVKEDGIIVLLSYNLNKLIS
jgi:hypothetical protein